MFKTTNTSLKNKKVQLWARRLHIYISMSLLLIVLFFSITGITLNRPHLFVKEQAQIEQRILQLPEHLFSSSEGPFSPDKVMLLDYLDEQGALSGSPSAIELFTEVEDGQLIEGEISLDYKGPGYSSSVFIDMLTQQASIETTQYGVVALLNDLHKGRNSGEVWRWFIDISAFLMVLFVLTGVCLLVPKKKTFNLAMKWTAFGSLVSLAIYLFAVP
jgi:hypothetical protein